MTLITRRGLVTGIAALVAAPAIVRVGSIMPVKTVLITSGQAWCVPQAWSIPDNAVMWIGPRHLAFMRAAMAKREGEMVRWLV